MKVMKKCFVICLFVFVSILFLDIVSAETYNNYTPATGPIGGNYFGSKSCGGGFITGIPSNVPRLVSILYNVIQIAVPVVLVVMGSIDLVKGITAQKEDEIKKGQHVFVKRLIAAALVFFVFVIVKLFISFVADGSGNKILQCVECFIENKCR